MPRTCVTRPACGCVARTSASAFLLVPEGVVELSPSAAAIAELIDGNHTLDGIAAALAERFDAPADTLRADVAEFCDSLRDRGHVIAG